MSSVLILESLIYLIVIIILHRIIKLYVLNKEYLTNGFDSNFNTAESWDELEPIETIQHFSNIETLDVEDTNNNGEDGDYVDDESEEEVNNSANENETVETVENEEELNDRLHLLNDRFSINSYNNCNISKTNLNYANINESEILNNTDADSLNKQFETYWTQAKNTDVITEKTFDSIVMLRNNEEKTYFGNEEPNKVHNINEVNDNYLNHLNNKIVPSEQLHNTPDNSDNNLNYDNVINNTNDQNQHDNQDNHDNHDNQDNQENITNIQLEMRKTDNQIELSDVRNTFSLETNKELSERVNQISAYSDDSFLAAI